MGNIAAERDLLDASIGAKDEVIDWTAFDEDVGVVRFEPMKVVDVLLAREHVIDLTLDGEAALADGDQLGRLADEAEIAGFLRQRFEVECADQFKDAWIGFRGRSGGESRVKCQNESQNT